MNFSLGLVMYWLFIFSCNYSGSSSQKMPNIDTTFMNWNKATLQSLAKKTTSKIDSTEEYFLKNRTLAFKAFVDINTGDDVNVNSIRYQFIREVLAHKRNQENYYVVEANRSGEQVEITNYLVYSDTAGKSYVEVYNFTNGKWVRGAAIHEVGFVFSDSLMLYREKFRLGFNQDDVIITRFENRKVVVSEYYLFTTLRNVGNIKDVLSLK
jgi:hypothetical protein